MTTITVTAGDTAQAMDKIVERLGEDALILETVKRNGRIEMIATDSIDETEEPGLAVAPQGPKPAGVSGLNIEVGGGPALPTCSTRCVTAVRCRPVQLTILLVAQSRRQIILIS